MSPVASVSETQEEKQELASPTFSSSSATPSSAELSPSLVPAMVSDEPCWNVEWAELVLAEVSRGGNSRY